MKRIYNLLSNIINFGSFEFFLTQFNWPNGGTIILLRTLITSSIVTIIYGTLVQLLDPSRTLHFNRDEFYLQLINSLEVFAAVFAGIYLALYSRFSSQWSYLANLYNQIKQTESSGNCNEVAIKHWKAGFIEDAIALHLAKKTMFAMIIKVWGADPEVKQSFEDSVHDGKKAYEALMRDVNGIHL